MTVGPASPPLRTLSLFSGIGGLDLGFEWSGGFRTAAFCEIDPFCRAVLAKHWPGVPIFADVSNLFPEDVGGRGAIDAVIGGFPCQPTSLAGQRLGEEDDRWLWPKMARLVAGLLPRWVVFENPTGIVSMGLDVVLSDLEALDYEVWPVALPAAGVGAPHKRERIFGIAAYAGGDLLRQQPRRQHGPGRSGAAVLGDDGPPAPPADAGGLGLSIGLGERGDPREELEAAARGDDGDPHADADEIMLQSRHRNGRGQAGPRCPHWNGLGRLSWRSWLAPEPSIRRVDDGFPGRVDRLKSLGNAVVPQLAYEVACAVRAADAAWRLTVEKGT